MKYEQKWQVSLPERSFKDLWVIHHISLSSLCYEMVRVPDQKVPTSVHQPRSEKHWADLQKHTTDTWYKWKITFVIASHQDFVVITTAWPPQILTSFLHTRCVPVKLTACFSSGSPLTLIGEMIIWFQWMTLNDDITFSRLQSPPHKTFHFAWLLHEQHPMLLFVTSGGQCLVDLGCTVTIFLVGGAI